MLTKPNVRQKLLEDPKKHKRMQSPVELHEMCPWKLKISMTCYPNWKKKIWHKFQTIWVILEIIITSHHLSLLMSPFLTSVLFFS